MTEALCILPATNVMVLTVPFQARDLPPRTGREERREKTSHLSSILSCQDIRDAGYQQCGYLEEPGAYSALMETHVPLLCPQQSTEWGGWVQWFCEAESQSWPRRMSRYHASLHRCPSKPLQLVQRNAELFKQQKNHFVDSSLLNRQEEWGTLQ